MIFDKILKIFTDEYDDDEIVDRREKKTKEIVKPKETTVVKTAQMKTVTTTESLDDNSNLRRAKPFTKVSTTREDEAMVSQQQTMSSSSSFRRIDFDPVINLEETKKEVSEPVRNTNMNNSNSQPTMLFNAATLKQKPFVNSSKEQTAKKPVMTSPTTKASSNSATTNPNYYKPTAVISPIYGNKDMYAASNASQKPAKRVTKLEVEQDDPVLSPMYGVVTEKLKAVKPEKKSEPVRAKKQANGNMTLEEMLSMDAHDQNLEFTLFDVKVDQSEFVSRENKVIKD